MWWWPKTQPIFQAAAPGIGLELKLTKCELIPTAGRQSSADLTHFPGDIKRKADANFDFLGAPVGTEAFCKSYLREKRLDPSRARLSALKDLEDAHAAYKILSTSLGSC